MIENIYNYLYEYGFNKSEIDIIEKENDDIFYTTLDEVKKNIDFLESKQLDEEDIVQIVKRNPFILTEKNNRLQELNEIYNVVLRFDYEELINIIKTNPETYTISPIELQKMIDYMYSCGYAIDSIKKIILKKPRILSMTLEEFKDVVKFN